MILPVGHDRGVLRLPKLTIGLIVLNILIYLITAGIMSSQQEESTNLILEMEKLKQELYLKYRFSDHNNEEFELPEAKNLIGFLEDLGEDREKFWEKFEEGKVVSELNDDYIRWKALKDRTEEKKQHNLVLKYGFIPSESTLHSFFTSLFLHAGILHLFGNMLFLWLVGCNMEDTWGRSTFLIFYLISGIAACLMHAWNYPDSTIPVIGASGAIAGIMGAFMIRHYNTRIKFVYFFLFFFRPIYGSFHARAYVALAFWIAEQLFWGLMTMNGGASGVAFWAHIGGFAFGAGLAIFFKYAKIEEKYIKPKLAEIEDYREFHQHPKLLEGFELMNADKHAEATESFKMVVKDDPSNFEAHQGLFKIYLSNDQKEEAIASANKLIELIINKQQALNVTEIYFRLKDSYPKVVLKPQNQFKVGRCLAELEDHETAIEVYKELV